MFQNPRVSVGLPWVNDALDESTALLRCSLKHSRNNPE